ncbi:MAG: hypothetical protein HN929_05965 [Chloroflexi bacterium]|jgi:hypothetical protein|nr:hypothetical protein [Chloroflexota bacterium]
MSKVKRHRVDGWLFEETLDVEAAISTAKAIAAHEGWLTSSEEVLAIADMLLAQKRHRQMKEMLSEGILTLSTFMIKMKDKGENN